MILEKACSGAGTPAGGLDIFRDLKDLTGDRRHGHRDWAEFRRNVKYALEG